MCLKFPFLRKNCFSLLSIEILLLLFLSSSSFAKKETQVFFPDTAYELNIYRIYGKTPGKTLMLIGGIQGNEPGGFLSADLYADMSLEKGNLIVVPRANFYSIILNKRGHNGDMNRKFSHEENDSSMDDKIVNILKKLISESDYFINLHDGAGYYYPEYINKWRNPMRFGQSIIADCDIYPVPGTGKSIQLEKMAKEVIEEVNPHISNELYQFHFMNTRTGEKGSPHEEQRKSATYYALNVHHIPAFGVETSKFLPSVDLKVRYHNLVINSFMKKFGIIPQSPGLSLDAPSLKYLVISINGNTPIVIKGTETLELLEGDSINISHIEANYERGLSLDILGYGDLNDYRKDFRIFRASSIIVRKDNHSFAEIPIKIRRGKSEPIRNANMQQDVDYFVIEARGERLLKGDGETFEIVMGEKMKILDVFPSTLKGVKVNFKGFVGDRQGNSGEDRGFEIDTANDLMKRFSIDKKGILYPVVVSRGDNIIGELIVKLIPPQMDYLVMKVNGDKPVLLRPDDSISLYLRDKISMQEVRTNFHSKHEVQLSINGHEVKHGESRLLNELCVPGKNRFDVLKGPVLLGSIFIDTKVN